MLWGSNMNTLEILLIAIALDAIFGEPEWLWSRIPHPIAILGNVIRGFDNRLNKGNNRKIYGIITMVLLIFFALLLGWIIQKIPTFGVLETICVAILLAHKSLVQHVLAVAKGLTQSLDTGRAEVAQIVGRETAGMSEISVARAAIESAAENFSDGVIAPALWFLFFGLPGLFVYKVVNTADSMIGYKTQRHQDFGFAAAKLDDLMNWVPARITGLLICRTSKFSDCMDVMLDDAPLHRSPNAGWPEAAMAAVLGVALSGPRTYDGKHVDYPYVNADARHNVGVQDIRKSVKVINIIWIGVAILIAVGAFLF